MVFYLICKKQNRKINQIKWFFTLPTPLSNNLHPPSLLPNPFFHLSPFTVHRLFFYHRLPITDNRLLVLSTVYRSPFTFLPPNTDYRLPMTDYRLYNSPIIHISEILPDLPGLPGRLEQGSSLKRSQGPDHPTGQKSTSK